MSPHADDPSTEGVVGRLPAPERPQMSSHPPRILIVGAGSRGDAYATAMRNDTNGLLVAIAEPIIFKRRQLGRNYIWGKAAPSEGQEFAGWQEFLVWEQARRLRAANGDTVPAGVDGVFICVQDEMHKEVIAGLAPLGLHIMCEKPLATSLEDCISIYRSLLTSNDGNISSPSKIFSIGHVLRYSPHNMLLRRLLLEEKVIGDIMSVNHTEPIGWWHFTHSYVRGNWRRESMSAPSLLTKCCHDIDLLLWLLCSPPPGSSKPPHIPTSISSFGALQYFNKARKPTEAGDATNCLFCSHEASCKFSAKKVYVGDSLKGLGTGNTGWPVDIVLPDIEESIARGGQKAGESALLAKMGEDYDATTSLSEIKGRNWFGRCVYEADNDVCDNQTVTMSWDPDPISLVGEKTNQALAGRGAKTATMHMVAFTEKQCDRYSYFYGTDGEIYADSSSIVVQDFKTKETKTYYPHIAGGGHGGGDGGLARQFVLAIDRVKNHGQDVTEAQQEHIGCSLEEIIRSHAMVFAADEARVKRTVVDFPKWWKSEVEDNLRFR
ncbi:MAG: hypothetical protein M1818_005837 [Claussenomyces sp. TS43310]|nr:MAG: hypothetical protein M1818_005837 [Claussenomyces sp. TS43310]